MPETTPDRTSSDYDAMISYWELVSDLTNGLDAMIAGGERYLPRFESEDLPSYQKRLQNAKYTNIYSDIVENLAQRPFATEIVVDASPKIEPLLEDIDGQGNNIHNFAATHFRNAIDYSVDWIYVDYTRTNPMTVDASGQARRKNVVEERQSGARPYWIRVPAREMIAVYSAVVNGAEEFVHCRMIETHKERSGWEEIEIIQVRELNREPVFDEEGNVLMWGNATFRIWQEIEQIVSAPGRRVQKKLVWTVIDEGDVSIGIIPITPLVIGERKGNSWQIIPALKSCATLQREYYEEENGLKNIKKLTAYPMLTAEGVTPEREVGEGGRPGAIKKAPVGPRAVLYGPPSEYGNGKWSIIEPAGTSLTFLASQLQELAKEMRELGRQPLTQSSGQMTTVTSVGVASKGSAAIQRWALLMKDTLENALYYTALWVNDAKEPTVTIDLDFDLGTGKDDGYTNVLELRKNGDLTRLTALKEAKRRNILSSEVDPEEEDQAIDQEAPTDAEVLAAAGIDPKTGKPVVTPGDMSPLDDPNA